MTLAVLACPANALSVHSLGHSCQGILTCFLLVLKELEKGLFCGRGLSDRSREPDEGRLSREDVVVQTTHLPGSPTFMSLGLAFGRRKACYILVAVRIFLVLIWSIP